MRISDWSSDVCSSDLVADIHFLLPESGLKIVAEHFVRVRHCLLALPGAERVTEVLSHPQALGQCRKYLRAEGIKPVAHPDTAAAAADVIDIGNRSEEHTSELQSLMRISYAVFCLQKKQQVRVST